MLQECISWVSAKSRLLPTTANAIAGCSLFYETMGVVTFKSNVSRPQPPPQATTRKSPAPSKDDFKRLEWVPARQKTVLNVRNGSRSLQKAVLNGWKWSVPSGDPAYPSVGHESESVTIVTSPWLVVVKILMSTQH